MYALLTDTTTEQIVTIILAAIAIVPASLAAFWSRTAKRNSEYTIIQGNKTLHEVRDNGGIYSADPTLKDYMKFVAEKVDHLSERTTRIEKILFKHLDNGED